MTRHLKVRMTKEVIKQLYKVERKTAREIAEIMGCNKTTVLEYLKMYKLKARRRGRRVKK